jgi:hypothetical protein
MLSAGRALVGRRGCATGVPMAQLIFAAGWSGGAALTPWRLDAAAGVPVQDRDGRRGMRRLPRAGSPPGLRHRCVAWPIGSSSRPWGGLGAQRRGAGAALRGGGSRAGRWPHQGAHRAGAAVLSRARSVHQGRGAPARQPRRSRGERLGGRLPQGAIRQREGRAREDGVDGRARRPDREEVRRCPGGGLRDTGAGGGERMAATCFRSRLGCLHDGPPSGRGTGAACRPHGGIARCAYASHPPPPCRTSPSRWGLARTPHPSSASLLSC